MVQLMPWSMKASENKASASKQYFNILSRIAKENLWVFTSLLNTKNIYAQNFYSIDLVYRNTFRSSSYKQKLILITSILQNKRRRKIMLQNRNKKYYDLFTSNLPNILLKLRSDRIRKNYTTSLTMYYEVTSWTTVFILLSLLLSCKIKDTATKKNYHSFFVVC